MISPGPSIQGCRRIQNGFYRITSAYYPKVTSASTPDWSPAAEQASRSPWASALALESGHSVAAQYRSLWSESGLVHRGELHLYSITSSARSRNDSGILSPNALAVLRLTSADK